jgi:hypothetical protein
LNNFQKGKSIQQYFKLSHDSGELLLEFKVENFGVEELKEELTFENIPNLRVLLKEGKVTTNSKFDIFLICKFFS